MTTDKPKKRAQSSVAKSARPRTLPLKKRSSDAHKKALEPESDKPQTQQIAMRELLASVSEVYPKFDLQPPLSQAHTTDEGHLDTLHRIARHLRERAQQYADFYLHFKATIGTNVDAKIAEHSKTFEGALEAVKKLPTKPRDPEVVHDVLRKMSAAAHALIFLQRDEITVRENRILQLERELATLKNPDREKEIVNRLHQLWLSKKLEYNNPIGTQLSVADWIENNLIRSGFFTEEEINLLPTSTYRHVDKHLYKALHNALRKHGVIESKSRIVKIRSNLTRFTPSQAKI